jgi:spore germination cell wall hydrolase CwlJ-like protein
MYKKSISLLIVFLSLFILWPSIHTKQVPQLNDDVLCMARNIYHEAGIESEEGKRAVSQVVLNRLNDPRYPKDICSIVYQRRGKTYQFSWVGENKTIKNFPMWQESFIVANEALENNVSHQKLAESNALFYHASYVHPRWKYKKIVKIGKHIFYADNA